MLGAVATPPGAMKASGAKAEKSDGCARPAKLFIGGITRHTTTKQLRDHFSCYGRVLDCVAMRQPDGRPRGFGYVTLDSPAAADRCLAEPQVIDNRVVDMKRAVPEGSTGAGSAQLKGPCMSVPIMSAPRSPAVLLWPEPGLPCAGLASLGNAPSPGVRPVGLSSQVWPWGSFALQEAASEAPDCVELLSRGCARGAALAAFTAAALSASAPEFVPAVRQDPAAAPPAASPRMAATRTPLGELTNITNLASGLSPAHGKVKAHRPGLRALGVFAGSENVPTAAPAVPAPAPAGAAAPAFLEIREDTSEEGRPGGASEESEAVSNDGDSDRTGSSGSDSEGAQGGSHRRGMGTESSAARPQAVGLARPCGWLPSVGSAEHAAGTCKRCNFFPKGRCQSGSRCTFCHFPHEKHTPSRQERRERRAAWLSRCGVTVGAPVVADAPLTAMPCHDQKTRLQLVYGEDAAQRTAVAHSTWPGVPPILSVRLPAPLPLPAGSGHQAGAPSCPCPPPGLPPPERSPLWQPEEEVSPLHFGMPSPATRPAPVLATVPLAPTAPQSIAASASPASTSATREMASEPPAPQGSTLQPAPAAVAAPVKAAATTTGTQTEEDLDFPCPRCCGAEAAMPSDGGQEPECMRAARCAGKGRCGRTWQREELLSFRSSAQRSRRSRASSLFAAALGGPEGA